MHYYSTAHKNEYNNSPSRSEFFYNCDKIIEKILCFYDNNIIVRIFKCMFSDP